MDVRMSAVVPMLYPDPPYLRVQSSGQVVHGVASDFAEIRGGLAAR